MNRSAIREGGLPAGGVFPASAVRVPLLSVESSDFQVFPSERDGAAVTVSNREAFLCGRAAYDGSLDALVEAFVEASGPPVISAEFAVHHAGDRSFSVRRGRRPRDPRGVFVRRLDPRDPEDLPPARRQYGFENRSFAFDERALDRGRRGVASVRLPDYPIRRVVPGRHPGRSGRDFVRRVEFAPER